MHLHSIGRIWLGATALMAAFSAAAQPASGGNHENGPPSFAAKASHPVPDHYIVLFKADVANSGGEAASIVRAAGGQLHHSYGNAVHGFSARLPAAAVSALKNHASVALVEQDQTVAVDSIEMAAPWGLDRIDQTDRPLNGTYTYQRTGAGVNMFIIDTGIRADHVDFAGRVLGGFTSVVDGYGTADCNGHGTHVSGIAAGTSWGVARAARLIPVRVLGCDGSGTWSGVLAGIDWVAGSALRPAVANLSLSGGASPAIDTAIANAAAKGVTVVVAAGNSSADACLYSPSRAAQAIAVGATTSLDARASYSNFGPCVGIFAPGTSIQSAWSSGSTATAILSGTSMASPHVAGVAALVLEAAPLSTPSAVASFINASATSGRLASLGAGSPDRLLYSLVSSASVTVAVKAITGSSMKSGAGWRAVAAVAIRDLRTGAPVANAAVSGSFVPGGASSCVTAANGICSMMSGEIDRNTVATAFSVVGVGGVGLAYDASQNSSSQVRIQRP